MSILSSVTGIGVNPFGKTKVKIDPLKAAGTALTIGSMGGLRPVAGALGRIPGVAAGAAKVGGVLSKVPGATKVGGFLLNGFGKAGQVPPPIQGQPTDDELYGTETSPAPPKQGGGWLDTLGKFAQKPGFLEAGANVVGGVLKGQADAARLKQEQQQFARTQGTSEAGNALAAERQRAAAPLRDQATYLLQQRMGVPNQQFQPHDIYNESYGSGPANLGGQDPEELKRRAAGYRPGAGGVNQALYDAYIKKYGAMR